MATVDEINAQMTALRQQINQLSGASGIGAASQLSQLTAQYNSLLNQKNRLSQQSSGNTAQQQAEAARNQIMQTAQGGIDRLKNDPTDQMLRQYLQTQMGAQVLDPNAKPFADGAPQYTAQGMQAQNVQAQQGKAFTYDPTQAQATGMDAASVNYRDPFDQTTIQAMVNEQAAGAGAAESARNQLIRDAALANGGNAFDPSLAASQAESLSQRNRAVANARNQINMVANRENAAAQNAGQLANAGFRQQAGQFNAGAQNSMAQFNAGAQNQAGQFNAASQQNASFQNAGLGQQANLFNAGAQNQASAFNAGAQNQAGMFNVGNQMQAGLANFNAGTQAQMYNQGQRMGAAQGLGSYNNQRQGMLSDAEGRLINVVGNQVFRSPETQMRMGQIQLPNFGQYQQQQAVQPTRRPLGNVGTYQNPSIQAGSTSSVWAGSGKPSQGSGTTTSSFGPTQVGNPYGAGASVGTTRPAVNRPTNSSGIGAFGWGAFQQAMPKIPAQQGLAPQIKKPINPNDFNALGY
jgi:hypothetical protein